MKNYNIAILGNGRAGKDTAGIWLGMHVAGCRYVGSASDIVNPLIARELGVTPEESWATRHLHRKFWYDWCNEFRKNDPTKFARATIEAGGNLIIGLRDKKELDACREAGLFRIAIWIENPSIGTDRTVTFSRSDCDVVIDNDGNLAKFFSKLTRFFVFAGYDVIDYLLDASCAKSVNFSKVGILDQDPGQLCVSRWRELLIQQSSLAGLRQEQWLAQCNADYRSYLGLST